jgi:heme exporter protein D
VSLIPGELWAALGAALAAIIAFVVGGLRERKRGREEAIREAEEVDRDEAERIRQKLDSRDRSGSVAERLRRLGKWRG